MSALALGAVSRALPAWRWMASASIVTITFALTASVAAAQAPGAFRKTGPPSAIPQGTSVALTWTISSAASTYEVCVDTTNDGACTSWTNVGNVIGVGVSGLTQNVTYYWQVRAMNGAGTTYADSGTGAFCQFSVGLPGPTTSICTGLAGSVQAVAVDPIDAQIAYAGTTSGIYKTTNGGSSWTRVDSGLPYNNVRALAIQPEAPCAIYAGMETTVANSGAWPTYSINNTTAVLVRSLDCGLTWGIPVGGPAGKIATSLAFSSANPAVLYSSILVNDAQCVDAFPTGFCTDQLKGSVFRSPTQQFFDQAQSVVVATDPANACVAYLAVDAIVYKNTSCSTFSWANISTGLSGVVTALAVHPTDQNSVLAAADGGIYRKADAGSSWVLVTPVVGSIKSIVFEPGSSTVAYAAGSSGGVFKTNDGGATWNPLTIIGFSVSSLAISPGAPGLLYVSGGSLVVKIGTSIVAPTVTTSPATSPSSTGATLHGTANPNGASTTLFFDYGLTTGYGSTVTYGAVGSGTSAVSAAISIAGLSCGTTYQFRARGENSGGTSTGNNLEFATSPCPVHVDLNGDGNGDAFIYNPTTGSWSRQNSQGGGGFVGSGGGWAPGWTVAPAQFNNDSLTDFFVFSMTTGQWFKMLTDGSGLTAQSVGWWWTGWQRHILDLDGDGISDVFLYDPVSGQWFKCIATPTGFVYYAGWWSTGWDLYPMHLNGDARADLFLISRTTGQWVWVVSESGDGFSYPVWGAWAPDWSLYPGDFNGDGLSDLLLHQPANGQFYVATNTGAGFSYEFGAWSLGWTIWIVDFDGDGAKDLFLYDRMSGQWFELRSDGAGHFTSVGSGWWSPGWDVYPTDFNADRRTDLLLYNSTTGQYYQAWNLFLGSFAYFSGAWDTGLTIIAGLPVR